MLAISNTDRNAGIPLGGEGFMAAVGHDDNLDGLWCDFVRRVVADEPKVVLVAMPFLTKGRAFSLRVELLGPADLVHGHDARNLQEVTVRDFVVGLVTVVGRTDPQLFHP